MEARITHEPTSTGAPSYSPTTCWLCSRRATGVGVGSFGWDGKGDPHFLCENCIPLIEQIRATTSFDRYEKDAIQETIEMAAPFIERFGSDLGDWTEEQVTEFVAGIILGFGTSIRRQVRSQEVPF